MYMTIDLANLRKWVGSTESRRERITAFPSNALAATLNRDDAAYEDGSVLPHLWHWLHFLSITPLDKTGPDGHAARGDFLPPVPLPRRMWAGGRFRFHAPLHINAILRKISTVNSVAHKTGRSGDLVFVTVLHEVFDDNIKCLEEEHDIVYRAAARAGDTTPTPPTAPLDSAFSRKIDPDPVLLFRYSALTFNSHRIHYDQPYVTETEGYPGLVVHGPLIATLLMDLLHENMPDAQVTGFSFRNLSPLYDTDKISIHGQPQQDGAIRLWAQKSDGAMAMDATATLHKV
jgi:3-methylfumaryl-CoA hydratase